MTRMKIVSSFGDGDDDNGGDDNVNDDNHEIVMTAEYFSFIYLSFITFKKDLFSGSSSETHVF